MSPDAHDLKEQIKMAKKQQHDAERHIAEEKNMLKVQIAEHNKQIAEHKKEKDRASSDLSQLA